MDCIRHCAVCQTSLQTVVTWRHIGRASRPHRTANCVTLGGHWIAGCMDGWTILQEEPHYFSSSFNILCMMRELDHLAFLNSLYCGSDYWCITPTLMSCNSTPFNSLPVSTYYYLCEAVQVKARLICAVSSWVHHLHSYTTAPPHSTSFLLDSLHNCNYR